MKKKNPLHVPGLRAMFAARDSKPLQNFRESRHAAVFTELIFALSLKKACTASRPVTMSCRTAPSPPGIADNHFKRDREESDKPVAWSAVWRIAP